MPARRFAVLDLATSAVPAPPLRVLFAVADRFAGLDVEILLHFQFFLNFHRVIERALLALSLGGQGGA